MKKIKYKLLRQGILYDAIGMTTAFIPGIGPFLDIFWAPYAAKKMSDMYQGNTGKIAAVIVFLEEILPFTDFIPTFTLMWIYTYVLSPAPKPVVQTIEVEVNE
ncbi:MAG: hypothetical protein KJO05_06095 [Bacteroidia bacterium]|nr:hypothetical protein [Bacteroidia bacterium]NNF29786.1 hypothetical protein [Flavobacteriaceae bacterium]MBT8274671.1 hypothetical protein [Bacteroidia bacterium]NNJ82158.1 hypothetical protein [Flavobacteriaceae bacterium]NNK55403.1 hypothetical protein [Flavobacteriaceae bacterium]